MLILQGTFSHDAWQPGRVQDLAGKHPVAVADPHLPGFADRRRRHKVVSESWRGEFDGASPRAIFSCLPSINKAGVAAVCGTQAVG